VLPCISFQFSEAIVSQGSSHFSTLAAALVWARTGCVAAQERILFLDWDGMIEGRTPTAYLHGRSFSVMFCCSCCCCFVLDNSFAQHPLSSNWISSTGTNLKSSQYKLSPTEPGVRRWKIHTGRFISGLPQVIQGSAEISLDYDPWDASHRIHMRKGIPHIDNDVFAREAGTWLGRPFEPVWPGSCRASQTAADDPYVYVSNQINAGAEHFSESHFAHASFCFSHAAAIASKHQQRDARFVELYQVARDNFAHVNAVGRSYGALAVTVRRVQYMPPVVANLDNYWAANQQMERQRQKQKDL
jgi:hypothetical protein